MSPPACPLDVINLALLQLFAKPLTNLTNTDDPSAIAANLIYDQTREELLRNHTWNFARSRTSIPLLANVVPLFDFMGAYQLPVDLLKLHHVGTEYDMWDPVTHDLVAGNILYYGYANDPNFGYAGDASNDTTNWPPTSLFIEYTTSVTDVTTMDALFLKVLRLRLAAELCMPITGDLKLQMVLEGRANKALAEALAINHQERPMRVIQRDPVAEARLMDTNPWDGQLTVPPSAWPS